jgi:hypothetical protein
MAEYFPNTKFEELTPDKFIHLDMEPNDDAYKIKDAEQPADEPQNVLGVLYYKPEKINPNMELKNITFNAYGHGDEEINVIIVIIKRLFIMQSVWKYEHLWNNVKNPPFDVEYNASLFSEENFAVALSRLARYIHKVVGELSVKYASNVSVNLVTRLFNHDEIFIYKPTGVFKIEQVGEYYVLFPVVDQKDMYNINIDIESYIYSETDTSNITINLESYTKEFKSEENFKHKQSLFENKYFTKNMLNINESQYIPYYISTFLSMDMEFYIKYLEMMIESMFKSDRDINIYYKKFLNFLYELGAVVNIKDINKYKEITDKIDNGTLTHNANTIIGYITQRGVKLYTGTSWIVVNKSAVGITNFKENPALIGYFEEVGGSAFKFKVRRGSSNIKVEGKDSRLLERGIVCQTKHKSDIIELAKQIGLSDNLIAKSSNLCFEILIKLTTLEINNRDKKTNIKYLYAPGS